MVQCVASLESNGLYLYLRIVAIRLLIVGFQELHNWEEDPEDFGEPLFLQHNQWPVTCLCSYLAAQEKAGEMYQYSLRVRGTMCQLTHS